MSAGPRAEATGPLPPPGVDILKCTLSLTIDGTVYKVPGGQLRSVALTLESHGFDGRVEFALADDSALGGPYTDTLYTAFVGDSLIAVTLSVETPLVDRPPKSGATPLELQGLVSERSVVEHAVAKKLGTSRLRRYQLRFVDPAQLVWRQHFPCELYTKKTWQEVISANLAGLVKVSYDWALLTEAQPHVFLGHEPAAGAASFYDFVVWLADTRGGFFSYDYAAKSYRLTGSKPAAGPATQLHPEDVAGLRLELPVLPRHSLRVHNTYTEQAKTTSVPPTQTTRSISGVHHDYLLRTPIAGQVDTRVMLEQQRLNAAPESLLRVEFARWPTSPLCPGSACTLTETSNFVAADAVLPTPFSGATARIRTLRLAGEAVVQELDHGFGADRTAFRLQASVQLELESTKAPPKIAYLPPSYPRLLEGKVVSEEGEASDETYQIYEDADTSVESYQVQLPLFSNQKILVDFQPLLASGHFYFPAYKNARVLVAVELGRAWLVRYLDWRSEARLPKETQGNNLLVGKTPQSGASLRHLYEDNKPVFRLIRTHDKDTQLIEIAEGHLLIRVKENS